MNQTDSDLLNEVAQAIYDKKGFNILGLNVTGLSSITDYIIIAEGNVDRHIVALAKAVIDVMKEKGYSARHVEGLQNGDWVVVDFLHVMVHFFVSGMRQQYHLEGVWPSAQLIDLKIEASAASEWQNSFE